LTAGQYKVKEQQFSTISNNMTDAKDTVITLKGSVQTVSEFFFTAINSILYQRGKLFD